MGSSKGNNKYLTPDKMWDLFLKYKEYAKANPKQVKDWVGGAGKEVTRLKEIPLTIEGFENYCADIKVIQDLGDYFSNNGGAYKDFISVCSRIKKVIRQDQIEGGAAMIYHSGIVARLNALVEKTENKHEVSEIVIKHES